MTVPLSITHFASFFKILFAASQDYMSANNLVPSLSVFFFFLILFTDLIRPLVRLAPWLITVRAALLFMLDVL